MPVKKAVNYLRIYGRAKISLWKESNNIIDELEFNSTHQWIDEEISMCLVKEINELCVIAKWWNR